MNEFELRSLLADVGTELGHADRYLLADLRHTVVDDVVVDVINDPQFDPNRLILHFDMGELPDYKPLVAMERLLRLNLLSGSKTTGVFALAPSTSQVVYAVHFFEPQRSTPRAVADALREHAQKAKHAEELMRAEVAEA
jgi:hypothetical protein